MNGVREYSFSLVQLTTSRVGNLTRLIHALIDIMTIHTSYINAYFYVYGTGLKMVLEWKTIPARSLSAITNQQLATWYLLGSTCSLVG